MSARPNRADPMTPEEMVAKLAPSIERVTAERAAAKADRRAQFPLMAEMTDLFRDAGMAPRPVHARNEQGEEWGHDPDGGTDIHDTRCHTVAPGYEQRLIEVAKKWRDTPADYRARQQRCIKPNAWRVE